MPQENNTFGLSTLLAHTTATNARFRLGKRLELFRTEINMTPHRTQEATRIDSMLARVVLSAMDFHEKRLTRVTSRVRTVPI